MKKTIRIIPLHKDEVTQQIKVVLLQKSGNSKDPNAWELPGGKLDPGKTWKETAINELKEETGIFAEIKDLEKIGSASYINTKTKKATSVTYYALWLNKALPVNIGETFKANGLPEDNHQGGKWCKLRNLRKLKISNNTKLLWNQKRLRKKLHKNFKIHCTKNLNLTS